MQNINTLIHDMIIERVAPIAEVVQALQNMEELAELSQEKIESWCRTIIAQHEKERAEKEPQKIQIEILEKGERRLIDGAHPQAATVFKMVVAQPDVADRNVVCWGDAGTGKSYMAKQIATLLDVDYHMMGAAMSKYDLIGFLLPSTDKEGQPLIIETGLMKAWRDGGVVLLDDFDRSDAKAVAMINNATANGELDCSNTGQGIIHRHDDCYVILTSNTPLNGSSDNYSEAVRFDKATKDRFSFIKIDLDEKLELLINLQSEHPNENWVKRVQKIRAAALALGGIADSILVTIRASKMGSALLAQGLSQAFVEEAVIFKGAGEDVVNLVYGSVGEPSHDDSGIVEQWEA